MRRSERPEEIESGGEVGSREERSGKSAGGLGGRKREGEGGGGCWGGGGRR